MSQLKTHESLFISLEPSIFSKWKYQFKFSDFKSISHFSGDNSQSRAGVFCRHLNPIWILILFFLPFWLSSRQSTHLFFIWCNLTTDGDMECGWRVPCSLLRENVETLNEIWITQNCVHILLFRKYFFSFSSVCHSAVVECLSIILFSVYFHFFSFFSFRINSFPCFNDSLQSPPPRTTTTITSITECAVE